MLKKIKPQGLFLLSFLAISVFLNGCQNQMSCDGVSAKNANLEFSLLGNVSFENTKADYFPVSWNNSIFIVYPDENTLTIFKVDSQFKATEWKKISFEKAMKEPSMFNSRIGIIKDKLFYLYVGADSNGNRYTYILLINKEGELVQTLDFPQAVFLLANDTKEDMLFLNLGGTKKSNRFFRLDEHSKLKVIDEKEAPLYFNGEFAQPIFQPNEPFVISPFSPSDAVDSEDRSVMRLYHINSENLAIKEAENFGKQYQCFFYSNQQNPEKLIITTKAESRSIFYEKNEKKLYFSTITDVLFQNNISRRLSETKYYLGVYDIQSNELSMMPNAGWSYFIGKMDNHNVLFYYEKDSEKNIATLQFSAVKDSNVMTEEEETK